MYCNISYLEQSHILICINKKPVQTCSIIQSIPLVVAFLKRNIPAGILHFVKLCKLYFYEEHVALMIENRKQMRSNETMIYILNYDGNMEVVFINFYIPVSHLDVSQVGASPASKMLRCELACKTFNLLGRCAAHTSAFGLS